MNNYRIDRERWCRLDIVNQMGNIGSEVGRSIKAWREGHKDRFEGALERALDLFSATAEQLARQKSPRLKEVLLARDQYLSLFFDNNFAEAKKIENYFMQFALAARHKR